LMVRPDPVRDRDAGIGAEPRAGGWDRHRRRQAARPVHERGGPTSPHNRKGAAQAGDAPAQARPEDEGLPEPSQGVGGRSPVLGETGAAPQGCRAQSDDDSQEPRPDCRREPEGAQHDGERALSPNAEFPGSHQRLPFLAKPMTRFATSSGWPPGARSLCPQPVDRLSMSGGSNVHVAPRAICSPSPDDDTVRQG
jgi:hypothetical protein